MIKTVTQSAKQGSAKDAEYTSESAGVKQASNPATQAKSVRNQANQSFGDTTDMDADMIQEELRVINLKLKAWQDRVNELLNDPNNADKIANLLNSIQYMVNRKAELSILLRQYSIPHHDYNFQDHQSILHASSVRRKDADALNIIDRESEVS